ncbi:hypothetical protein F5B22DRAFT_380956 [Xylaria bambusicola]|uniref:uncharacterized protein n=1 Tax=Xylaria bambusicola TaxID=326684 RepID=UPI0020073C9A|nr:uncharacterized protein F5B22DRAFT_380956 [Xylaria bambusicola]KAI0508913.1 hypothetical protein F5B22DRAFT_380956 [Xylaria bambusicola]
MAELQQLPHVDLPQPDFHALSGHLQGMAVQVDRCSNLVAVHHSTAILDAIAALNNTVNTAVASINTSVAQLRTEMQEMGRSLGHRMDDLDFNSRARTSNSGATRAESIIHPLRNTTTHEVVDLPRTVKDLFSLRVPEVEQYLRDLGQVPVGNEDEKKAQLNDYLGINRML